MRQAKTVKQALLCQQQSRGPTPAKSCTRFQNPNISGKISAFTLKKFCSLLLCHHQNKTLVQLISDVFKPKIEDFMIKH